MDILMNIDLELWGNITGILGFFIGLYIAYQQVLIKKNLVNNHIHQMNGKKLSAFIKLLGGSQSFTDLKAKELKEFLKEFKSYNVSWWHWKAKGHLNKINTITEDDFETNRNIIKMHLEYLSKTYRKWWEMNP